MEFVRNLEQMPETLAMSSLSQDHHDPWTTHIVYEWLGQELQKYVDARARTGNSESYFFCKGGKESASSNPYCIPVKNPISAMPSLKSRRDICEACSMSTMV